MATPTVRVAQWSLVPAIAIARECSARTLKPIGRARPQEYWASSSYAANFLAALIFPHRRLAVGAGHFEHAIVRRIAFLREGLLDRQLFLASDHVARKTSLSPSTRATSRPPVRRLCSCPGGRAPWRWRPRYSIRSAFFCPSLAPSNDRCGR